MNRIDFTKPGGFPFTQDDLAFMQSDYVRSLNGLATAWASSQGAQYVILSGCVDTGGVISSGICSVNGELVYCAGGSGANVRMVETTQNATFENGQVHPVYITRMLVFQDGEGQIPWTSFVRVPKVATATQGGKADTALQSKALPEVEVKSTSIGPVDRYAYYKVNDVGQLEIKGQVAVRNPLFILEPGYIPSYNVRFLTSQNSEAIVEIDIDKDTGNVSRTILSGQVSLNNPFILNQVIPL